jgi:hypothetical protein
MSPPPPPAPATTTGDWFAMTAAAVTAATGFTLLDPIANPFVGLN